MNKVSAVRFVLIFILSFALFMSISVINAVAEEEITISIEIEDFFIYGTEITYEIYLTDSTGQPVDSAYEQYLSCEFYDAEDLTTPVTPKDVGEYRLVVIYDEGEEPDYSYQEVSADFEITVREIKLIISNYSTYGDTPEFDDWNILLDLGYSLAPGDEYPDLGIDFSWMEEIKDVGVYKNGPDELNNANYSADINWMYVIEPLDISMSIQSQSVNYGDEFTLTASLNPGHELKYEDTVEDLDIQYRINGELFTGEDFSIYQVGQYTVTATYDNDNYTAVIASATLTINKYEVLLHVEGSIVYGTDIEQDQSGFTYQLISELPYDDVYEDLGLTYYVDSPRPIVGNKYLINAGCANNNYRIFIDTSSYLTVTPKVFKAKIIDKTVTYGDKIEFELETEEGFGYATGDNINSLQVTFEGYDQPPKVRPEPYTISAVASSPNYSATIEDGTLTVLPKDITVEVNNIEVSYGSNKNFSCSLKPGYSLCYQDQYSDLGITITANEINVGKYQADISYNNDNYNVTFTGGEYEIKKKLIKVKINDLVITYGETPVCSSIMYEGNLQYDDTIEDLNITYIPDSRYVGDRYSIGATYDNDNYEVDFRSGNLDIKKRPVKVIIDDITLTYGETPVFTYSLDDDSSLAPWDDLSDLNIVCSSTGVNVSETPLKIQRSYSNENYLVTFNSGGYYVLVERDITIKVKDITKQYGQEKVFGSGDLEIIEGSMAFGEALSALNMSFNIKNSGGNVIENNLNINIGEYALTMVADNTNYNVTVIDGTLKIKKREVKIEVEDTVKAYGDRDSEIKFTADVPGLAFTGKLTREPGEEPGEYRILLGTLKAGENYELILSDATLTIDATLPPVAYAGLGILGLSVIGIIYLIIRKILGSVII
jgi:hypothetical protein